MDNLETEVIETEVSDAEEVKAVDIADDEEWGDDLDFSDLNAEDDGDDEVIEFGVEADQPDEEPDVEPEAPEAEKPAEEQKDDTADQRFNLKHLDEVKEVNRDEVIQLAQKGMDYDRIRTERDAMKADYGQLQDMKAFMQELADNSGMSIEDFVIGARAKLMMAKDETLTEEAAMKQLKAKAVEDNKPPEEDTRQQQEAELREKRMADVKKFNTLYPNVKAEDIPPEVYSTARDTGDLAGAYSAWRIKQLEEEIAVSAKNKKNENRSTGSRKTGGKSVFDNFDAMWDDGT